MTDLYPLVSLIVRTEGRRKAYLADAIQSAVAQTYRPLEIVVVEDGSRRLADGIKAHGADTDAALIHVPVPKSGRSAAGNAGLAACTGTYVGFLDEDDLLLPEHVESLLGVLQSNARGCAAYAAARMVATPGLVAGRHPSADRTMGIMADREFSRAALWAENYLPIQSVLFPRSLYEEQGGFDEALAYFEDWDLWLRYSRVCPFVRVNAVTSVFRIPAERKIRRARSAEHATALPYLRAKHANEEGPTPAVRSGKATSFFVRLSRKMRFS